ncbi:hypothetical protein CC1G_13789 [Coprinopsis cinerea okayama7|uniref:Uncharacterized protein n=1 Tax=Coprinopsis cinerea (strain Okayama-7 / 130 / ATCC MYA-4618 / FGSC 9003) TaxID=240176 RepID=D6RK96_COPC7|nr:hypothetical protein CC1G_13789 [Coprinopsis cinerea okayama7\|eukprot:XP_002912257.1 hypothetical protein CC1G_13789 [Coprinopsis cinerea okayama7\
MARATCNLTSIVRQLKARQRAHLTSMPSSNVPLFIDQLASEVLALVIQESILAMLKIALEEGDQIDTELEQEAVDERTLRQGEVEGSYSHTGV